MVEEFNPRGRAQMTYSLKPIHLYSTAMTTKRGDFVVLAVFVLLCHDVSECICVCICYVCACSGSYRSRCGWIFASNSVYILHNQIWHCYWNYGSFAAFFFYLFVCSSLQSVQKMRTRKRHHFFFILLSFWYGVWKRTALPMRLRTQWVWGWALMENDWYNLIHMEMMMISIIVEHDYFLL